MALSAIALKMAIKAEMAAQGFDIDNPVANGEADKYIGALSSGIVEYFSDESTIVINADNVIDTTSVHKFTNAAGLIKIANALQPGDDVSELVNDAGYLTSLPPLDKNDVGLGNVDNTSDLNKPISTATQTALDGKATTAQGALADSALQTGDNVSKLVNDAGYITSAGSPVQTVNGQTGTVVLDADDVSDSTTTNKYTNAAAISKLAGIATGAEVNQNAFSNFAVAGQTTIAAETKTDTLTMVGGTGMTLTNNATTDTMTFSLNTGDTRNSDHASISVIAGAGITGGGTITTNRTLNVGAGDGITVAVDSVAVDSSVVRTTGTQSIAGAKTFTGSATFAAGAVLTADGTQIYSVATINFSGHLDSGFGWSDGGRNPGGISVLVNGIQTQILLQDVFTSIVPIHFQTRTVTQINALATLPIGAVTYCSNGNAGQPCLAVNDGSSWKRIALGATISAT